MDFTFNVNEIFKQTISKINYSLLPTDFSGDRSSAMKYAAQVAVVIDAMGQASATAHGLQYPTTTADELSGSEHTIYLIIDAEDNHGNGSVAGMLKIGEKSLILYDEGGMMHEMKNLCVLDFYVNETKQRTGFGKMLFDHMLQDMNIEPCKLALDTPSEYLLSFLNKHYGMGKIYPQNNNFVLFEGFFNDKKDLNLHLKLQDSSDRIEKDDRNCYNNHSVRSDGYTPKHYGRHQATKPKDTMGQIVGGDSASSNM